MEIEKPLTKGPFTMFSIKFICIFGKEFNTTITSNKVILFCSNVATFAKALMYLHTVHCQHNYTENYDHNMLETFTL